MVSYVSPRSRAGDYVLGAVFAVTVTLFPLPACRQPLFLLLPPNSRHQETQHLILSLFFNVLFTSYKLYFLTDETTEPGWDIPGPLAWKS